MSSEEAGGLSGPECSSCANALKYRTHQTDFSALAQELHSGPERPPASSDDNLADTDEVDDEWSDYTDPADRD